MAHHGPPDIISKRWTLVLIITLVIIFLAFLFNTQRDAVFGILNYGSWKYHHRSIINLLHFNEL